MSRLWLAATLAALAAGCGGLPYEEEPLQSPEAPPPARLEIPAPPAAPGRIWIPGRWVRSGEEWVWSPGRHVDPGDPGLLWIPGTWSEQGGRWNYTPGRWIPDRPR